MNSTYRKAALFILVTFSLSWPIAIVFFALGGQLYTPSFYVMAIIYMFVPMVAAILVQKLIFSEPLRKPLGISFKLNRWFLVGWLLPLIIAIAGIVVSLWFPGVEFTADPQESRILESLGSIVPPERLGEVEKQISSLRVHPFWLALVSGLVAGITVNAVAGFGEELGWRGLLQRELRHMGFWKSSLIIGLIWGIWHTPIILQGYNYPEHPVIGTFMMVILCLLLAPIFSYVRLRAKSVIAAAVIHGSFNATAGLPIVLIKGGSDLTVGVIGLGGFIVLALLNVILFLYDRFWAGDPIKTSAK